jgi:hypothetical protein
LSGFLKTSLDGKGYGAYKERKVDRVGFESFSLDGCPQLDLLIVDRKSDLRKLAEGSWLHLPPCQFLSVVQLRYYSECNLDNCRTSPPAIPILCPSFLSSGLTQLFFHYGASSMESCIEYRDLDDDSDELFDDCSVVVVVVVVVVVIDYGPVVTVSELLGESFALYRLSPAKCAYLVVQCSYNSCLP